MTVVSKMFTYLVVLLNTAILVHSQICNLDDRLHVLTTRESDLYISLKSYLAFICPSGFLQNSSHCAWPIPWSQPCPALESLNLEYNITKCNIKQKPMDRTFICAYPISQFLAIATENNDIKLELFYDREFESLELNVYSEKPLQNIQENLHCWGKPINDSTARDVIHAIPLESTFPIYTADVTALRYTLQPQKIEVTYFCIFLKPGKHKSVISNKLNMLEVLDGYNYVATGKLSSKFTYSEGLCHFRNLHFGCHIIDGITVILKNNYLNVHKNINYLIYRMMLEFEKSSYKEEFGDYIGSSYVEELDDYKGSSYEEQLVDYMGSGYEVKLDEYIISNRYCLEYNDTNYGVIWCKTKIGTTTTPCETPCVDNEGNIITRTCEGSFLTGARWSQPSARCSTKSILQVMSSFFPKRSEVVVTPTMLRNISAVIRDNPNVSAIDLESISIILSNAVNQNETGTLPEPYFDAINNVLDINETVFSKVLHSRENILYSVDQFVKKISTSPANLTYTNLALKIYRPYSNLTNSFDQVLTMESISAKFPMQILEQLLKVNNEDFTIAMTVFKNRKLFSEGIVASEIADLIIPGGNNHNFSQPISIYIQQNSNRGEVVCAYWKYGKTSNGNWSSIGVETRKTNATNIVECRTYHLTSFALLGISETAIEKNVTPIHKMILKYISTIGCALSLFGTIITIFTAIACRNWFKRRIYSLQLSCVVLLEVIMLFVADTFEFVDIACIVVGAIMHYLVLVKFLIMLLIAKQQYSNFVSVMKSRNNPQNKSSYTAIILIVPLTFVTIAACVFPHKYNSGNLSFCYPKEEIFLYFLILPISIILLANGVVFGLVMIKISNSISGRQGPYVKGHTGTKNKLQLKLAFMLWFMLGMAWFFGIFAKISITPWVQLVFVYAFCIFGTVQGFVVFWFIVIRNKDAMIFWRNNIEIITQTANSSIERSTPVVTVH